MSQHAEQQQPGAAAESVRGGPEPESIRFFGTTWVDHDGGYAIRRVAVAVGSLVTAFAACLVLRLAYEGLAVADLGGLVGPLIVAVFAVCSAIAFGRAWTGFKRRPDAARDAALRGLTSIGFVGSLIAYFLRSLAEAPGEALRRAEYEAAVTAYERRRTARSGNPASRRTTRKPGR